MKNRLFLLLNALDNISLVYTFCHYAKQNCYEKQFSTEKGKSRGDALAVCLAGKHEKQEITSDTNQVLGTCLI